jgi:hypothetical protein
MTTLAEVETLAKNEDAAALVALEDHSDKKIRKAARRALHKLRSRGVEIPTGESRSWSAGSANEMRPALEAVATVDLNQPGVTRVIWAEPDDEEGSTLIIAAVAPNDAFVEFQAYGQTDGQRARMTRDWERTHEGRTVPADWARARLRWSREATVRLGYPAPRGADDLLERLGELPDERPSSFLGAALDGVDASEDDLNQVLLDVGAVHWPLLFEADALFERLEASAKARPESDTPLDPETRAAELAQVAAGDEGLRAGLSGDIANAIDDAAIGLWLGGRDGDARRLYDLAAGLRDSETPEAVAGATEILSAQITGVVLRQQSQAQSSGAPG